MDLLTHGLLGATLAQATFVRRLGKSSLGIAAVAAILPDVDMVASLIGGPMAEFKFHRSLTHSFWFGPLVAWLSSFYLHQRYKGTLQTHWFWLITLVIMSHPFLDICTSYGTQFFYPFSTLRVRWNIISVIDLGFTPILILSLLIGGYFWRHHKLKAFQWTGIIGLGLSLLYLEGGHHIQKTLQKRVEKEIGPQTFYEIHPTFFQPWTRRVYMRRDKTVCVNFLSYFDETFTRWLCRPQDTSPVVQDFLTTPEAQTFWWYASGNIYLEHDASKRLIRMHDIRYSLPETPFQGVWGIEVSYDEQQKYSALKHFKGNRQITWERLKSYLKFVFFGK